MLEAWNSLSTLIHPILPPFTSPSSLLRGLGRQSANKKPGVYPSDTALGCTCQIRTIRKRLKRHSGKEIESTISVEGCDVAISTMAFRAAAQFCALTPARLAQVVLEAATLLDRLGS